MTVYVIQKPKQGPNGNTYDISPAKEYGEIKFIFDAYDNCSSNPEQSYQKLVDFLDNEFNVDEDYVLWAGGDPYALVLAGYAFGRTNCKLRFLRWERYRRKPDGSTPSGAAGYYTVVNLPAYINDY